MRTVIRPEPSSDHRVAALDTNSPTVKNTYDMMVNGAFTPKTITFTQLVRDKHPLCCDRQPHAVSH
jgi:hypothetical protein